MGTAPGTALAPGWEVFVTSDGVYQLTYTIASDAEGDQVIDLSRILGLLKDYVELQGSEFLNQPGDGYKYRIFVKTDSKHTYKYKEGSFSLSTPDVGKVGQANGGKPSGVVGFDGQTLPENTEGNHYIGESGFNIAITSRPIEDLLVEAGIIDRAEADMNLVSSISYSEALDLVAFINKKCGSRFATLDEALEGYLLGYYSAADGKDYTDFETMMKDSQAANDELYSGTQANKELKVDSQRVTNLAIANALVGSSSTSTAVRFAAFQDMLNEKLGTDYGFTGSSSRNWGKLRSALAADGYAELAELVPNGSGNTSFVPAFLKAYDFLYGDRAALAAYFQENGWNPNDFSVRDDYASGRYNAAAAQSDPKRVRMPLDPATRYDNFYKNLLSFVYGDKEKVDGVTGELRAVTEEKIKGFATEDGTLYTYNIEKYGIPIVIGPDGEEFNICDAAGNPLFWEDQLEETVYVDLGGSLVPLSMKKTVLTRYEFGNDSWTSEELAEAVAGYMKKNGSAAWKETDAFLKKLFEDGLSADEGTRAKQIIDFFAAFNLDGELTGNDYQLTEWSFSNSMTLEQMDGGFQLEKVDQDGKKITGSEATFQIWHFVDANGDGIWNDGEEKYYYTTITGEDGRKTNGFVKYDPANKELTYTIDTVNGELNIDYAMLRDVVYYLQEVVAPKGYEIDSTVKLICTKDRIPEGFDMNNWLGEIAERDADGRIKTLKVELVNCKEADPGQGGKDPDPGIDPQPGKTPGAEPESPVKVTAEPEDAVAEARYAAQTGDGTASGASKATVLAALSALAAYAVRRLGREEE